VPRLLLALFCVHLFALGGIVAVVTPERRLTKRVLFVVDASGSMQGDKFARACRGVLQIAEQPIDEVEVGVLAFNDETARWPGLPEDHPARPVPDGWAALPSAEAVASASAFLAERGAYGDTLVIPALRQALAETRDELSVVVVTDGVFQRERSDDVLAALAEAQQAREERGLGRAVVLVYGVGREQEVLRELGAAGQGGYFREEPDRVPAVEGLARPR